MPPTTRSVLNAYGLPLRFSLSPMARGEGERFRTSYFCSDDSSLIWPGTSSSNGVTVVAEGWVADELLLLLGEASGSVRMSLLSVASSGDSVDWVAGAVGWVVE